MPEPARRWRVTVNSFMATGGDGLAILPAGTDRVGGGQDIDALVRYLSRYLPPNPPFDPSGPAMGEPRILRERQGAAGRPGRRARREPVPPGDRRL